MKDMLSPVSGAKTDDEPTPKYDVHTVGQIRIERGSNDGLKGRVDNVKRFFGKGSGHSLKSKKLQWAIGWTHVQSTEALQAMGFRSYAQFFAHFVQAARPTVDTDGMVTWLSMEDAELQDTTEGPSTQEYTSGDEIEEDEEDSEEESDESDDTE